MNWVEIAVVPFQLVFGGETDRSKIDLIEALFDSGSIETSNKYVYPEDGRIAFCGDLTSFSVYSDENGVFIWRWIAAENEEAADNYIRGIHRNFDKWVSKFELNFTFEVRGSASMVFMDDRFVFQCMSIKEINIGHQVISTLFVDMEDFEMICHWFRPSDY